MILQMNLAVFLGLCFFMQPIQAEIIDIRNKNLEQRQTEILGLIQDTPDAINGRPLEAGQRLQIKNNKLTDLIRESSKLCELDAMESYVEEQRLALSYLHEYGPKLFPYQSVYLTYLNLRFLIAEAKVRCGQYTQENLDEMLSVIKAKPPLFIQRDHPGLNLPEFQQIPSIRLLETQYLLIMGGHARSYLLNRQFNSLAEFLQVSDELVHHLKEYYENNRAFGIDPSVVRLIEVNMRLIPRSVPLRDEAEKKVWLTRLESQAQQYREEYSTHPTLLQARATTNALDTISKYLEIAKSQMLKAQFAYGLDLSDVLWELMRQKLEKVEPGPLKMNFAIASGGSGLFAIDLMRAYAKLGDVKSFEQFIEMDFPIHTPKLSSIDPRDQVFTPSIYSLAMYFEAHLASLQLGLDEHSESFLKQFHAELEALAYGNWIFAGRFSSEVYDIAIREYLFQAIDFQALTPPQKAKLAKSLYRTVRLIGLVNQKLDQMEQRLKDTPLAKVNETINPLRYSWELDLARFKANPSETNRVSFRKTNDQLLQATADLSIGNPWANQVRKNIMSLNFGSFLYKLALPKNEDVQLIWLQDQNSGHIKLIAAFDNQYQIYDLNLSQIKKYTALVSEILRSDSSADGSLTRSSLKLLTQAALPEDIRALLVKNTGKKIYVYAEGFLSVVPVEIFLMDDGRFLIQSHTVSYQTLPGGSPKTGNTEVVDIKKVTVFADADYGQLPESVKSLARRKAIEVSQTSNTRKASFLAGLQPLPYTREEAKAIEDGLSVIGAGITIFEGNNATLDNLAKVQRPDILHLALHGFVQSDKAIYRGESLQYLTGIAFAGANYDSSSLLTVHTFKKPDLEGTDLVVLAACDTSVSDASQANDYVSMRNMFFKLGVSNVIAAHWSLPDAQTSDVMRLFYRNLAKKMDFQDALREAKLKQMEKTPNPKYWAGLTLTKR